MCFENRFLQFRRRLARGIVAASTLAFFTPAPHVLKAQLSSSAYRALGQPDLRQNALNIVEGKELFAPNGIALDRRTSEVHLFVSDTNNHRILAWRNARAAGAGQFADLILGQPSARHVRPLGIGAAGLAVPLGLGVDPVTGDLYVADFGNNRVLRFASPFDNPSVIEPGAVIGQPDFTSRGPNTGGVTDHSLNAPSSVAFDNQGNLWVADTGNHRVLRFPRSTLASLEPAADLVIGQTDFTSRGANQTSNQLSGFGFNTPSGLALRGGNLYVSDFQNARVLRFDGPLGTNQEAAVVFGQQDFTTRVLPPQPSASVVRGPLGLDVGPTGDLYIAIANENRVLIFDSNGPSGAAAKDVLGQSSLTATRPNAGEFPLASASTLNGVADVKLSPDGDIWLADRDNNRILSFPEGSQTARWVWGQPDFISTTPNQVKPSSINAVFDIAIDYSKHPFALYVSDINNHRVLVWKDSTRFTTGAGADLVIGQPNLITAHANIDTKGSPTPSRITLASPRGVAVDSDGNFYVADSGNNRVLRYPRPVEQTGRIEPDAVLGQNGFSTSASAAVNDRSLNSPAGVAIARNGSLFVSDSGNNRVLQFPPNPSTGAAAIRVFGQPSFFVATNPPSPSAQTLTNPQGLTVDSAGFLYVVDGGANRCLIYTGIEGAPEVGNSASIVIGQPDFESAAARALQSPLDVDVDSQGQIFVSDSGNNRVLIYPSIVSLPISGAVASAVVGQPGLQSTRANWNSPDGLATAESLFSPAAVFIDRNDTLYVGDTGNNRLVHFLKPAVVVNASHFRSDVPVSPGALVSIFGAGFSDDIALANSVPLPQALNGRVVEIDDELASPILFLSPSQANLQLSSRAALGSRRIAVRMAETGEPLAGGAALIASASPGFFTTGEPGSAQGITLNEDGSLNTPSNPTRTGKVVTLFGTGQGEVVPAVADGQPAPSGPLARTKAEPTSDGNTCLNVQPSVCVAVGSQFGEVLFSGLAPGFVGLWQVNVTIPEDALTGPAVPLRAVINGRPSNIVTVAID